MRSGAFGAANPPGAGGASPGVFGGASPPAIGGASPGDLGGASPPALGGASPGDLGAAKPPAEGGGSPPAALGVFGAPRPAIPGAFGAPRPPAAGDFAAVSDAPRSTVIAFTSANLIFHASAFSSGTPIRLAMVSVKLRPAIGTLLVKFTRPFLINAMSVVPAPMSTKTSAISWSPSSFSVEWWYNENSASVVTSTSWTSNPASSMIETMLSSLSRLIATRSTSNPLSVFFASHQSRDTSSSGNGMCPSASCRTTPSNFSRGIPWNDRYRITTDWAGRAKIAGCCLNLYLATRVFRSSAALASKSFPDRPGGTGRLSHRSTRYLSPPPDSLQIFTADVPTSTARQDFLPKRESFGRVKLGN